MSTATLVNPEEYLARERDAEYRSEYWDGKIIARADAAEPHVLIAGNIQAALHSASRGRDCRTYTSAMRVQFDGGRKSVYPDVTVVCGERRYLDYRQDVLLNPTFVVEVLSPSTERTTVGRRGMATD